MLFARMLPTMLLGALVGTVAEWLGARPALTVMAIEGLIAIAISLALWPELRKRSQSPLV